MEKKHAWQYMVGTFKSSAPIFCLHHYACFVLYNIYCVYVWQTRAIAQMVGTWLGKRWDLGSIPRSPIQLLLFFLTQFHAALHPELHHEPHAWACQVARRSNPVVRRQRLGCTSVNHPTRDTKSQARPMLMGQNSSNTSLHGPDTPHWFALFFLFSFLFF